MVFDGIFGIVSCHAGFKCGSAGYERKAIEVGNLGGTRRISIMSLLTGDIFRFSSGYSFVWLAVLYFVGAAMKKSGFLNNVRKIWCLVGFLACSVIAWVLRVYGPNLHGLDLYINRKAFVGYTSPLIVFASVRLR